MQSLTTSQPWLAWRPASRGSLHRHYMPQASRSHWCACSLCKPMNLAASCDSPMPPLCLGGLPPAFPVTVESPLAQANQQTSLPSSGLQLHLSHQGWITSSGMAPPLLSLSPSLFSPRGEWFYLIVTLLS